MFCSVSKNSFVQFLFSVYFQRYVVSTDRSGDIHVIVQVSAAWIRLKQYLFFLLYWEHWYQYDGGNAWSVPAVDNEYYSIVVNSRYFLLWNIGPKEATATIDLKKKGVKAFEKCFICEWHLLHVWLMLSPEELATYWKKTHLFSLSRSFFYHSFGSRIIIIIVLIVYVYHSFGNDVTR